jgi:ankyrin repeat protein
MNATDNKGKTAYDYAIVEGHKEIADLLRKALGK